MIPDEDDTARTVRQGSLKDRGSRPTSDLDPADGHNGMADDPPPRDCRHVGEGADPGAWRPPEDRRGTHAQGVALQGLSVHVGTVIDAQDVDPRRLVVDTVQQPVRSAASAERTS